VTKEHEIASVDNDLLALVHARALLTSAPEGSCACLHADLRDPDGMPVPVPGSGRTPAR
jgi:hypothetical protein